MAKNAPPERWTIPIFDPLVQILFPGGVRRPSPILLLILAVGGGYWAWRYEAERVEVDPQYRIVSERIVATSRPDWIRADVAAEALQIAEQNRPLSGLDPQAAQRLAQAFAVHPWVAEVGTVRLVPPGGARVDLTYRRPACMVELPPSGNQKGLYAVDAAGTLLPSRDFLDEPKKAAAYPRLGGFIPANVGKVGARWPDDRVVGGAAIGGALVDDWTQMNLARIAPQDSASTAGETVFELLTRSGSRIVWGRAPGRETPGEMSPPQKVDALRRYFRDHGSFEGREGPQQLDLRGAALTVVAQLPQEKKAADANPAKSLK